MRTKSFLRIRHPDKRGETGVLLCTVYRTYLHSKSAKTLRFFRKKKRGFFPRRSRVIEISAGEAIGVKSRIVNSFPTKGPLVQRREAPCGFESFFFASAPGEVSEEMSVLTCFFLYPLSSISGYISSYLPFGRNQRRRRYCLPLHFSPSTTLLSFSGEKKQAEINSKTSTPDKRGKTGVLLCTVYRTYLHSKSAKTPRFSPS